ncbi:MAG: hypothetical protein ACK4HV_06635, partial [Parachlamydiaceae bacterium]
ELTDSTFFYSFYQSTAIPDDFLPYIEEKMRALLKAAPPYRIQSMVPSNASDLFDSLDQPVLAERCLEAEGEVEVAKIGDIYDLGGGEPYHFYFKLLALKRVEDRYEIEAVALSDEKALKEFVKAWKAFHKIDLSKHVLVKEDQLFFLPKGVAVKEEIVGLVPFEDEALPVEGKMPPLDVFKALKPRKWPVILQNRFESWLVYPVKEIQQACRSSLQRIDKTVNILSFETQVTLCGLRPQSDVSEWVKECWLLAAKTLETGLKELNFPYQIEKGRKALGPKVKITLFDKLGNRFEGPWLEIDCITSEKLSRESNAPPEGCVLMTRNLLPDFDQLTLKMIERQLLNGIEAKSR